MRKRMQVVVKEEAVLAHGGVERFFAGVSERRMADVVDQGQSLDQVARSGRAAPAMVRAICATSSVWVRRLRK